MRPFLAGVTVGLLLGFLLTLLVAVTLDAEPPPKGPHAVRHDLRPA